MDNTSNEHDSSSLAAREQRVDISVTTCEKQWQTKNGSEQGHGGGDAGTVEIALTGKVSLKVPNCEWVIGPITLEIDCVFALPALALVRSYEF